MKEKYTLLLLSLVFVVMLYGITSVFAGWSSPTTPFPTSNVTAPIDTGKKEQFRVGAIEFNRNDGKSEISVDIATDGLPIGDFSSTNYFYPYTTLGPKLVSSGLVTISAAGQGLVVPNIANPSTETAAKMEGNLVFDSTLNQLKVYAGNVWNAIGSGENFWTQDGSGISYTGGPVAINSARLVVNGDIKANETQPAQYYYFPEYSATPYFITDNPTPPQGYSSDILKYNLKFIPESQFGGYAQLPCDNNKNTLDCLSETDMTKFSATVSDPDIKIDIVHFDQAKNPDILTSGYYAVTYRKYPYQYNYVATGGYANTGVLDITPQSNRKPRAFCDVTFNPFANQTGVGQECYKRISGAGYKFPAPPPESLWPDKVYDWMWGSYSSNNKGPAAQEFTRTFGGSSIVSGGKISFPGDNVTRSKEFQIGPSAGNDLVEKKEVIGNYSFCALGRFWSDLESRGWCNVYYDINDSIWKISYGAWQNTGIACRVNCF